MRIHHDSDDNKCKEVGKLAKNTVDWTVYWGDTDMAGIIFYPNYFKWFDIGWHHLFKKIGLPIDKYKLEENIAFPS